MSGWTTHVTDNVVQLNFLNIIISTELQEIGKKNSELSILEVKKFTCRIKKQERKAQSYLERRNTSNPNISGLP